MGMMIQSIKKTIKLNFIFMGIIVFVFVFLSYYTQDASTEILGYPFFKYFITGMNFLFIIFSFELGKETLQEEKRSKRLEWYLANNMEILHILINHSLASFITTNLLIIPAIFFISIVKKEFALGLFMEYILITFVYSFLLNILTIRTVNMNRFSAIRLILILINIILVGIDFVFRNLTLIPSVSIKIVLLTLLAVVFYRYTSKESVVSSYF